MINTSNAVGALRKSGGLAIQINENFIRGGDEEHRNICITNSFHDRLLYYPPVNHSTSKSLQ
jgi:hypothetical protein